MAVEGFAKKVNLEVVLKPAFCSYYGAVSQGY
jgi:hypothetical protein